MNNFYNIYTINNLKQRSEKLIIALKIIGRVTETDKLQFRYRDVSIQKNSYITSMYRYAWGDRRKDTISGITSILDELENNIIECSKTDHKIISSMDKYIILSRLSSSLFDIIKNPNNGLGALSTTYSNDAVCQAHLESLTERSHLIYKDLLQRIHEYKIELNIESDREDSLDE